MNYQTITIDEEHNISKRNNWSHLTIKHLENLYIYIYSTIKVSSGEYRQYSYNTDDALLVRNIYIERFSMSFIVKLDQLFLYKVLFTMFHLPPSSTSIIHNFTKNSTRTIAFLIYS